MSSEYNDFGFNRFKKSTFIVFQLNALGSKLDLDAK